MTVKELNKCSERHHGTITVKGSRIKNFLFTDGEEVFTLETWAETFFDTNPDFSLDDFLTEVEADVFGLGANLVFAQ